MTLTRRQSLSVLQAHERFKFKSTIGVGTFGAVFLATDVVTDEEVAVKKVLLDPRYKNRELDIVLQLSHPNCLRYICHYNSTEGPNNEVFLHLVTGYLPNSLVAYIQSHPTPDLAYLRVYGYQLFAALAYLHRHGVSHRDIKSPNVLVHPDDGTLQLCDFGSAKILKPGEISVSYIATRAYRAPELLLDCPSYSPAIDVWAAGCVLCEMYLRGRMLFMGGNNSEMMSAISRILGPPVPDDFTGFQHKKQWTGASRGSGLAHALPKEVTADFLELMAVVLVYSPQKRATAADCMRHPFFRPLFEPGASLPGGREMPPYLARMRTPEEMEASFPKGPSTG
jgi:glycogen synthase kinase 3 beta